MSEDETQHETEADSSAFETGSITVQKAADFSIA